MDFIKLVVSGIVVFALLVAVTVGVVRWDFIRCYPTNPYRYNKQIEKLRPGMTKDQVKSAIAGSTHIEEESGQIIFSLTANRPALILPAIPQNIEVQFDRDGKMTRAEQSDG